jgi:hypothetical protein
MPHLFAANKENDDVTMSGSTLQPSSPCQHHENQYMLTQLIQREHLHQPLQSSAKIGTHWEYWQ